MLGIARLVVRAEPGRRRSGGIRWRGQDLRQGKWSIYLEDLGGKHPEELVRLYRGWKHESLYVNLCFYIQDSRRKQP